MDSSPKRRACVDASQWQLFILLSLAATEHNQTCAAFSISRSRRRCGHRANQQMREWVSNEKIIVCCITPAENSAAQREEREKER
jgi:hypothetical protein